MEMEPAATYFVIAIIPRKAKRPIRSNIGLTTNKTPNEVATALPPLKPAKIGKQ